jgi:import receptor subunit TOM70
MSSGSPLPPPSQNVVVDTASLPASSTASVWDRISKWVSENKALVYTIAGVAVVVTSAGVVYYLSDSGRPGQSGATQPTEKKKSKNQRRKEKKKAEEEKKAKASPAQDGAFFGHAC